MDWLRIGIIGEPCECGIEPPSSISHGVCEIKRKKLLGRPGRRSADNVRMDLKEINVSTRNYIDLVNDMDYSTALVNAAFNLWVS